MTTGKFNAASPAETQGFESAWQQLRADENIQFAQVELPPTPEQPDWLTKLLEWLGSLFEPVGRALVYIWPVLMWVLIGAAVLLALYFLYDTFGSGLRRRKATPDGQQDWAPAQGEALALLEEADRLAAAGDYDAATHLLLQRSVGQIRQARPDLVEPSSTARELAGEPRLPDAARNAFALIAAPVERSLFAMRTLDAGDWQAARAAYADFALAQDTLAAAPVETQALPA